MNCEILRLSPNADLKESLAALCEEKKIDAGVILTCVGSLRVANIRFANQDTSETIEGYHEIVSLVGMISRHGIHVHISISDSSGKTVGGHLMNGSLIYTTAEIAIGILPDLVFDRKIDPDTGYKELHVSKKNQA